MLFPYAHLNSKFDPNACLIVNKIQFSDIFEEHNDASSLIFVHTTVAMFLSDFVTKLWRKSGFKLPSGVKLRGWSSGLCRRYHPEIESWNSYPTWRPSDFNELVPPNRTHYAEVFYGSMILWHCNMVLIFELGSILINHFIISFRLGHFGHCLFNQIICDFWPISICFVMVPF